MKRTRLQWLVHAPWINAARVHAVENGEDLDEYTMIAFGGAAPLHAARLCEKLGVSRCLVPSGAGVGSAIGFLRAPFSFEANRSVFMRLSDFDPDRVRALFLDMEDEATRFVRSCDADAPIRSDHKIYMRYSGQGWEIPIQLTPEQAAREVPQQAGRSAFLFGPERSGLETDDVALARTIVTAPINPEFGSLNLAQAVILVAYELSKNADLAMPTQEELLPPAPQEELEGLIAHLERMLEPRDYFFPEARAETTRRTLRGVLTKPGWNHLEVRTLRGVLTTLARQPRGDG